MGRQYFEADVGEKHHSRQAKTLKYLWATL
jgi:hypothetical protein